MPSLSSTIIDIYLYREGDEGRGVEFLQLLRAHEPLADSWHPIMGHIEEAETAFAAAGRELREEVGLEFDRPELIEFFALQEVHPYFIAALDTIMLSPRFAGRVRRDWQPAINEEHSAVRWIPLAAAADHFLWRGQLASIREIESTLINFSPARDLVRLK